MTIPVKVCRHCKVEFEPSLPPHKPFGRFLDECADCSERLYHRKALPLDPAVEAANRKIEERRQQLRRELEKMGHSPAWISQFMRRIAEDDSWDL